MFMGLAILTFLAVFVLIGSAGLLITWRTGMTSRLSMVLAPEGQINHWLAWLRPNQAGKSIQAVIEPFDRVLPKSPQEVSITQKRLIRAGLRADSHLRIFYGSKVLVPIALTVLVAVGGVTDYFNPFMAYVMALGLGYLVPDFWLGRRIANRQTEIRLGLPDFLDLLVVCVEAGLSMDQAISRSAEELKVSQPEISDEMGLVVLEQRAGRLRVDTWKNLAERIDLDVVRSLVTAIIQADQFGTSLSKTLRVYSDGLRVKRRQEVEEKAAKTAVKLVLPLVCFIFPTLFIVALGPSFLVMADAVEKFLK
jgi:tight adherence protein C